MLDRNLVSIETQRGYIVCYIIQSGFCSFEIILNFQQSIHKAQLAKQLMIPNSGETSWHGSQDRWNVYIYILIHYIIHIYMHESS